VLKEIAEETAKYAAMIALAAALIFVFSTQASALEGWVFEGYGGSALNLPTPLTIEQEGEEEISFSSAGYETRAFEESPYYAWRVSRWEDGRSWELELVHHKIYLLERYKDAEDAIDKFGISHGYNQVTINRAWEWQEDVFVRLGGGVVIAHPHFTIRGEKYPEDVGAFDLGFHIAGPTAQAAMGQKFDVTDNFFLSMEGKFTASYAEISFDDADGVDRELTAEVPNVALHGLLGFGYQF